MKRFVAMKMILLSMMFGGVNARALTLKNAAIDACMLKKCDDKCQADEITLKKALTKCQKAAARVDIACEDFSLKTTTRSMEMLEGRDSAKNPIFCMYDETIDATDLYSCESYQGSPYANIKISGGLKAESSQELDLSVQFQDTSFDEPAGWHTVICTGTVSLR